MQVLVSGRPRHVDTHDRYTEGRKRGQRDDLVRVVLRQNPTCYNLALVVVQQGRRPAGLLSCEDGAGREVSVDPAVQGRLGHGELGLD